MSWLLYGEVSLEMRVRMLNKEHDNDIVAYWCVVSGSEIWTIEGSLPYGRASEFQLPMGFAVHIGDFKGDPVYWFNSSELNRTFEMVSLRALLDVDDPLFFMASRAVQLGHMTQSYRFCPQCATPTVFHHKEMAMCCPHCHAMHYPRISPCVMVAVQKNEQILLAQHAHHKNGLYTVIAGFLEVGETLEQCVAREVFEETGLTIKNIRYFGSQPWAFPSSMMMAFTAEYVSGNIQADLSELNDARWFSGHELPPIPPVGTLARKLIDETMSVFES